MELNELKELRLNKADFELLFKGLEIISKAKEVSPQQLEKATRDLKEFLPKNMHDDVDRKARQAFDDVNRKHTEEREHVIELSAKLLKLRRYMEQIGAIIDTQDMINNELRNQDT